MVHPTKKRLRAADRRASIIDRCKQLFARKGFHGVSVDEVARACEVSPAVLYQHFASKSGLYEAVLDEFACDRQAFIDAALEGPDDFAKVLQRLTLAYVARRLDQIDSVRFELRSIIDGEGAAGSFFQHQWQGLTDYIEATLPELVEKGAIPHTDIHLAGLAYRGMVRELILAHSFGVGGTRPREQLEDDVANLHHLFLRLIGLEA